MSWRPKDWQNPFTVARNYCGERNAYQDQYEAGADALLTSLLSCGIITISQLEALKKNEDEQGDPK